MVWINILEKFVLTRSKVDHFGVDGAGWSDTASQAAQAVLKLAKSPSVLVSFPVCQRKREAERVCFCSESKVQSAEMGKSRQPEIESALLWAATVRE